MVAWAGDGTLTGYNPTAKQLEDGLYKFASTGSVDLNGQTRMQYALQGISQRLTATAPITYVAADFPASSGWTPLNPYQANSAALYIAAASQFTGTPTPEQIYNSTDLRVWRADYLVTGAQTRTFNIPGPVPGDLAVGQKFWAMIIPTKVLEPTSPWNRQNDPVHPNFNIANARAISFWTNRAPTKPVITSPPAASAPVAGSVINLAFTTNDPDKTTPDDAQRVNADLAGVQVQYAAVPTQDDKNPFWRDLVYADIGGTQRTASWVIGQRDPSPGRKFLEDRGLPILCGASTAPALSGVLPGGNWQIRVRTADFGSPFPLLVDSPDNKSAGQWTMDRYPALNLSPWSDPVVVNIPSQVPPPVPMSPVGNLAIGEGPVRLTWKYRNTKSPSATPPGPSPQAQRVVQIRKVGDPNWASVFAGASSSPFVDLPLTIDNPPSVPAAQYLTDVGFESGTLGGWSNPLGGSAVVNVSDATQAKSGSRFLRLPFATTGNNGGFYREIPLTEPTHTRYDVLLNLAVGPGTQSYGVQAGWIDSGGNPITTTDSVNTVTVRPSGGWPGVSAYREVAFTLTQRPAAATAIYMVLIVTSDAADSLGARLDDVSAIGSDPNAMDDFTMKATTQYEWRVQAVDGDGFRSTFSPPARFWMVPRPASGSVLPVPTSTIDGATLGCGTHRVFVYRRGGKQRVGEITGLTHVDWSRTRDDISTARIEVEGWGVDCGNLLASLEPWAYEIVIFRDNGFGKPERVWEGPITLPSYYTDKVVIQAKDVLGYAYRRILRQAMSYLTDGGTVVTRAAQILQNGFAPDDPNILAYLQVIIDPVLGNDPTQRRSTPEYSRTVFEELDDMASNSGLDYVAVGRSIIVWGTRNSIGKLPEFNDSHLGDSPIVSVYGMSFANRYAISDGNGVWGAAEKNIDPVSGNDPVYGLVEMLSSSWASDAPDDGTTYTATQAGRAAVVKSFEESSQSSLSSKYPAPIVVRVPENTTLNPDTPVSIQQLVPGVAIPLRSVTTLRHVDTLQKLDSIKVTEEAGVETINIVMSPFPKTIEETTTGGEEG